LLFSFYKLGERTIGVLTKVDIMDHGTDCCEILMNNFIPLRRGYIAIINRSQKDIQENIPIRKGIAKEHAYFQSHPKYKHILSKCGTLNLSRSLNQILMHHIRDCLPDIKSRISTLLNSVQRDIDLLGYSIEDQNNAARGGTLLKLLSQFAANFINNVDGRSSNELVSEMAELYGGARISYIFNEVFGNFFYILTKFSLFLK
jgi:dynamin 1-like protein